MEERGISASVLLCCVDRYKNVYVECDEVEPKSCQFKPRRTGGAHRGLNLIAFMSVRFLVMHTSWQENSALVVFYFGQQIGRGGHHAHRIDGGGMVWLLCMSWKRAPDGDCKTNYDGDAEQFAHGRLLLVFARATAL